MLYLFSKQDKLLPIPWIKGLEIRENNDLMFLAGINQISPEEVNLRLENDHKAYVAYLNGIPTAFGWVAIKKARIGELNHEFNIPPHHCYLWNFRTFPAFRGLGIYVHLLQYILTVKQRTTDYFWIMHSPENKASQRGIIKAGFKFIGKVAVININKVILDTENPTFYQSQVPDTFGFIESNEQQPTCWLCSSPYLSDRKTECCCLTNNIECN